MYENSEVRKSNKLFLRELGANRFGTALYKWMWSLDLEHSRFTENIMKFPAGSNVLMPEPQYTKVVSYPWLGERWMFVSWQFTSLAEWKSQFGSNLVWNPRGDYYPTDLWVKEGKTPTREATEEIIRRVKHNRQTTISDLEANYLSEEERQDKALFNTIHDIISDEMTAFGNKPGSRSGGVSFPSIIQPSTIIQPQKESE